MYAPKRKDERSEFFAKSFAYTAILSENEKDRLPCMEICLIDTLSVDEGEYILEGHNDKQHHEQHKSRKVDHALDLPIDRLAAHQFDKLEQ